MPGGRAVDQTTLVAAGTGTDPPGGTVRVNREMVERPAGRSMLIRYAAESGPMAKRRLFNFTAAVSLVLCLGMIILWIACHGKSGFKPVRIPGTGGQYALVTWSGEIALSRVPANRPSTGPLYFTPS